MSELLRPSGSNSIELPIKNARDIQPGVHLVLIDLSLRTVHTKQYVNRIVIYDM